MQINFDDILTEWSYRLPKGFPTVVDGKFTERNEVIILNEILEEKGLNSMELPEAKEKALKLDDSKIDKILSTPTLKSLTISKQLLKPKNVLVLYAAGLAKASRADMLKKIAKDIKGKYVSHKCDKEECVNPNHLFLGTQKENLQDMASKGRSTRGVTNSHGNFTRISFKNIHFISSGHTP